MRILYLSQFFPPETGAAAVRAGVTSRTWSLAGHRVTILTGFPNYPGGRLYPGHRNRLLARERHGNLTVLRTLTLVPRYGSLVIRVLNQAAFFLSTLYGGLRAQKPDVVLASSPPFSAGLAGFILARCRRAPFVFEVRDLFPDSAVALGVLRNPLLIRILRGIERFYYRKADRVVAVTRGIRDHVAALGISGHKIITVPNGADISLFGKASGEEFRSKHHLDNRFVVMYAGLLGRAQDLGTVIEAARLVRDRKEISFVLVGEGVEKAGLQKLQRRYGLDNVLFLDNQKHEMMPGIIAGADLCIASRKEVATNRGALPVKLFEYMAAGKPVVVGIRGEAEEMVLAAGAGICIPPQDPRALADSVDRLSRDPALCRQFASHGRSHVERFFDRRALAERYLGVVASLGNGTNGVSP